MSAHNEGGSAFPHPGYHGIDGKFVDVPHVGMTLRDWFAGMALPALMNNSAFYQRKAEEERIADSYTSHPWQSLYSKKTWEELSIDSYDCAFAAYQIADAMITAKQEEEE